MIVTLPWPHCGLSPNARVHWRALAQLKKQAKSDAFFLAVGAGVRTDTRVTSANVDITFRPPDRRLRDDDNAIASLKSARDGVAMALGVDDAKWTVAYHWAEPVKNGCVVLDISV